MRHGIKMRSIRGTRQICGKGYWCILAMYTFGGKSVIFVTFFQNHIVSVYAAAQTEQKEDSSVQILQENLMEEIQIDDVQKMLDEIMDDHVFFCQRSTDEYHKRGGSCFKRDCTELFV